MSILHLCLVLKFHFLLTMHISVLRRRFRRYLRNDCILTHKIALLSLQAHAIRSFGSSRLVPHILLLLLCFGRCLTCSILPRSVPCCTFFLSIDVSANNSLWFPPSIVWPYCYLFSRSTVRPNSTTPWASYSHTLWRRSLSTSRATVRSRTVLVPCRATG